MATVVMLLVSGASLSMLTAYQKRSASTVLETNLQAGLRSAADLLAQEISQAGLLSFTPTTLTAGITGSAASQSVGVASVSGMFVGEKLQIDRGTQQEVVSITAIGTSSITGVFTQSHGAGAMVNAVGVFPQGILSSSTSTQLRLFGDINADGTMVYVRYDCSATSGTLSRSITPITASSSSPGVILVDKVIANSGGVPCFRYVSTTVGGSTFVTSVSVTLTARSAQADPQTGGAITETKSFLGLASRNVVLGVAFANAGLTSRLQPTPPGVPLS